MPKVILLLESSRASGRSLLCGIADFARHHGPWAFYWEPQGLEAIRPRIRELDANGIILRDVEKVEEITACGVPAVVVGHSRPEIPGLVNVVTDSEAVGRLAAQHLLDCRFRHFGYCGLAHSDIESTHWSRQRGESFRRRLQQAGFEASVYRPASPRRRFSPGEELEPLSRWLVSLPKPVAVMACNDDRARQVVEAGKLAGLRLPDDVAVLGADNDELVCGLANPPISSVAINFERAGYESAQALDRMMRHRKPERMTIPVHATHVVARQSTDVVFLDDAHVVRGLRFIRAHCRESIHVTDVARAARLSRRVLEKRFRKLLGRSVLGEIRQVRVDQICRLLVETNQPVSELALALGFPSVEHVARYFRQAMRMTPMEYRKRYGPK